MSPSLSKACKCGGTINARSCDRCGTIRNITEGERGSAYSRGYTAEWQEYSQEFRRRWPLCAHCKRERRIRAADHVDHITRHNGDSDLFWDTRNHQGLCHSCHSTKTRLEQAGLYDTSQDTRDRARQAGQATP